MSTSHFTGAHTVKLIDNNTNDVGTPDNPLSVSVSGAGSGGTSSVDKAAFTAGTSAGTAAMGVVNPSDTGLASDKVALVALDANRNLCVNVKAGSSGNAAASSTGSAVPSSADYQGINVGGNLRGASGFDLDTGAGTDYNQGVSLRKAASGGSVELGTATDPIRTDPTGSTTQPVSIAAAVTVQQSSASSLKVDLSGTAANATAIKVDNSAVTQPISGTVTAVGGAASGSAASGNPLRIGVLGKSSLPSIVTDGRMVDLLADRYGRLFVLSPILSNANSAGTPITTNTTTSCVAAPAAGSHLRIHRLWAQNSSATGTWCYWCDGTTKKIPFYLAQYQPFSMDVKGGWELTTATALQIITATTGANIEWFVEYETLTD